DVELQRGRAVFEDAKDARRPFVVNAGAGTITALGTQFQVVRDGERVSVALLEGSFAIDAATQSMDGRARELVPGQQASYAPSTRSWTVETIATAALTSWSHGFHVFAATPLQQAISEINRYSAVKLTLEDPGVGSLLVSGSFKLGDGRTIA